MYGGYYGLKQKWFLCKTSFDNLNASKLWKDQKYPPVPDRFEKKIISKTNFFARQRRHYFRKKTVNFRKYRLSTKKKMPLFSKLYNIPVISTAKNRMLLKTFAISANKKHLKNIFLLYKKKYPDVKFNSFYLAVLNRFKGRYKMMLKQKYTTFDAFYRKIKLKRIIFHDTMALVKPLVASFVSPKVDFKLFSTRDDDLSLKRKRSSPLRKLFRKKRILTSRDKKERNKMIRFNRKYGSPTPGIFGKYFHKYLLSVVSYNKAVRHIVLKYKKTHDLIYEAKQKEKKAFYAEQKKRKQQFYNEQKEKKRQFHADRKKKPIFEQKKYTTYDHKF